MSTFEGRIVFWNRGRGFGFIQSGIREYFFHIKNFEPGFTPVVGYDVEFELGPGKPNKPPQAVRVWYPNVDASASEIVSALKAISLGGTQ